MTPDTIVALATPPGRGALAVVRLSGSDSLKVIGAVAPGWVGAGEARKTRLTRLEDPVDHRLLDRALVTYFPAPASYTGEDVVEISTHGGTLVPALVLAALERAGARPAARGEFTQRAYLNGKFDLLQVEGIKDLVEARSEASHQAALHQTEGGLSGRLTEMRERLIGLEALLVHHVDFPEEDDPPVPLADIVEVGGKVAGALQDLLDTAPQGELLREGALVVLAGRPNSGKSSLFNALLGIDRAIVTERPGTTRDALEAFVSLEGYPFRLVDTAGLREGADEVELLGIEVARRYLQHAEVVLLCVSQEWGWGAEEERFLQEVKGRRPVIVLWTKADRFDQPSQPRPTEVHAALPLSVVDGRGLGQLRRALRELIFRGVAFTGGGHEPVLTRRRQADGVRSALAEVEAFVGALSEGVPAEMAATHLKSAATAVEELLGVISPDDILERVFAEFCVGK